MGQLARLFDSGNQNRSVVAQAVGSSVQNRSVPWSSLGTLSKPKEMLIAFFRGGYDSTAAGEIVDERTALALPAIMQAVRIRALTKAMTPLKLYKKNKSGGSDEVTDDSRAYFMAQKWSDQMCGFVGRRTLSYNEDLLGNGFAYLNWISENELDDRQAIVPIDANQVKMRLDNDGWLQYAVLDRNGKENPVFRKNMLHLPNGITFNGLYGVSPLIQAAQPIGTMLAAEKQAARYFKNGSKFSGAITHPGNLSKDAQDRLKEDFEQKHVGADNAYKPLFLEEGMNFQKISFDSTELELMAARRWGVEEAARIYNVPPVVLYEYGRATWGNMQEMMIQLVQLSMLPEFVMAEQILNMRMLTPQEIKKGYYWKFLIKGLLRGNLRDQSTWYKDMRNLGALNADEIRAYEELNPLPDGQGQIYLSQSNQSDLRALDKESQDESRQEQMDMQKEALKAKNNEQNPPENEQKPAKKAKKEEKTGQKRSDLGAWIMVFQDRLNAVYRRESKFLERNPDAQKRSEFYAGHGNHMVEVLSPMVSAALVAFAVPEFKRAEIQEEIEDYLHLKADAWCNEKARNETRSEDEITPLAVAIVECMQGDDDE